MFDLYLKPLCGTFWLWCGTMIWNLCAEPLRGTCIWSFYPEPSWQTLLRNVYVELRGAFLWNLGTFICGTWELGRVEPLCGTLGNLVPDFGRLPQTTPELYWKNPKLFKLLKKKISPCENPNSWWTGTVFCFDILWVTENMLCETKTCYVKHKTCYMQTHTIFRKMT